MGTPDCFDKVGLPRRFGRYHLLRLIARGPTYDGLVSLALADVRRNAAGNVRVLLRLYDAIDVAARHTPDARRRSVLTAQIALIEAVVGRTVAADDDRDLLARRARDPLRTCARHGGCQAPGHLDASETPV